MSVMEYPGQVPKRSVNQITNFGVVIIQMILETIDWIKLLKNNWVESKEALGTLPGKLEELSYPIFTRLTSYTFRSLLNFYVFQNTFPDPLV